MTELKRIEVVNLTPHTITLQRPDGTRTAYPSVGTARVDSVPGTTIGHLDPLGCLHDTPVPDGLPLYSAPALGAISDLPAPTDGMIFVVSAVVAAAARRDDVYSPGTGPNDGAVRENGQVVAVTRLIRSC